MHRLKFLLPLFIVTSACSASDGTRPSPEAPASQDDSAQSMGTEPVLGPDGVPLSCEILYEGLCYPNAAAACAQAGCPLDACEIRETYPGRLHCRTEAPPAPAPGESFALIGEGSGPDDGAGFNLIIGTAAEPGTGFDIGIGRWRDTHSCALEVSSAWYFEIEDRSEFAAGTPITLPYRNGPPETGDWLSASHRCGESTLCSKVESGSLHIDSLVPGQPARGSYSFDTSAGPIRGSFQAPWCGPKTER